MGVFYNLVNFTKKEIITYSHIPANKARELAGNSVSSAITTWYLLQNLGDSISFVSDTYDDWPFPSGSRDDLEDYVEVTDQVVSSLIQAEILVDEGRETFWPDEPDAYMRKLRNIWMGQDAT